MKLPPDWSEFIALLCDHQVRFLIVGAHALAANGRPRATQDLDIWVQPDPRNAARLCEALTAFGFQELGRADAEFSQPDRMATLGQIPLRIDVMTSIAGVEFEEAWSGRLVVSLGDREVPFLGREQFIKNKLATGRARDRLDVELLTEGEDGD